MPLRAHGRFSLFATVVTGAFLTCGSAAASQCGWHSGNYARTCSSHAAAGCLRAAKRNVPGFTVRKCQENAKRCSTCLSTTLSCARRTDRPGRAKDAVSQGCQKCDAGFNKCLSKQ